MSAESIRLRNANLGAENLGDLTTEEQALEDNHQSWVGEALAGVTEELSEEQVSVAIAGMDDEFREWLNSPDSAVTNPALVELARKFLSLYTPPPDRDMGTTPELIEVVVPEHMGDHTIDVRFRCGAEGITFLGVQP